MLYALKIATRYLPANKTQTSLLVFGVAGALLASRNGGGSE